MSIPARLSPASSCPHPALVDPGHLEFELLLSTPLSIVVRARAEFDDGSTCQEAGLVIARRECRGDRPSLRALYDAALACAARLSRDGGRRVRCLQARVRDGWMPLAAPAAWLAAPG